jgi:hypothetical protein
VATKGPEGRKPLFWRILGAAIIGLVVAAVATAYQQIGTQLRGLRVHLGHLDSDLRKEVTLLSGNYGEMVKKEESNTRLRSVWDVMKELRSDAQDLIILKERCAALNEQFKAGEEDRRLLAAQIQRLREQKTGSEERALVAREISRIRERIASLEGHPVKTPSKPAALQGPLDQEP